jgi:hypothetical protein
LIFSGNKAYADQKEGRVSEFTTGLCPEDGPALAPFPVSHAGRRPSAAIGCPGKSDPIVTHPAGLRDTHGDVLQLDLGHVLVKIPSF